MRVSVLLTSGQAEGSDHQLYIARIMGIGQRGISRCEGYGKQEPRDDGFYDGLSSRDIADFDILAVGRT